ncbi:MAG: hypothetical protein ABL929_12260 [Ferruginibacter sp.]|nr:hypothetical protein [Ferruginibacter sp.]
MKNIKILILAAFSFIVTNKSYAQSINWKNLKSSQKHILHLNTGLDYGVVFGLGYSYQLKSKLPTLLNISYSFPSGNELLGDFKTKIGGQVKLYTVNNFQFSASIYGIYRRYQNPLVRIQNFGSEITGVVGYYKSKWFVAGEAGFDKAIVTNFKHSAKFKEDFPAVKDGWYEPSTGGNFNYGIQTGYSLKKSDITLKIGKLLTQDFKTKPFFPYYLQLGYNLKIGRN